MTEKIIIFLQEISQYYYYIKFNFKVILFLLFSFTYGRKKNILYKLNMQNDAAPTKVKLNYYSFYYVSPPYTIVIHMLISEIVPARCVCWLRMRQRRLTVTDLA